MKYLLTWTEPVDFCGNTKEFSYESDDLDRIKNYYKRHIKPRGSMCYKIQFRSVQELSLDLLYENKIKNNGRGTLDD